MHLTKERVVWVFVTHKQKTAERIVLKVYYSFHDFQNMTIIYIYESDTTDYHNRVKASSMTGSFVQSQKD